MNYLIDSHCHLHDRAFFTAEQATTFLKNSKDANVRQVICIGTDPADSEQAHQFATTHPGVFWTYGIHPENANPQPATCTGDYDASSHPLHTDKLVAIGEIGLDYHYENYDRAAQIRLFEQMLQLARDLQLPVSLHIREAFADAWPVLDNFPGITGVVHSFTGNKRELKRALDHNFFVGVNGLATYNTLPLPPLEKMLLETDAPFLTPVPFRGTINQPAYVSDIAAYLAGKMGVAEETLVEQTTKNARRLFKLGDAII